MSQSLIAHIIPVLLCYLPMTVLGNIFDKTSAPCSKLSFLLPARVAYPSSSAYLSSIDSYFWQQEKVLAPACIVTPESTLEVSIIVGTLTAIYAVNPAASLFSVRSGGHGTVVAAANNNGGVTIDLSSLNSTSLTREKDLVHVGPGAKWQDVYKSLETSNITVSGGRVAGIGVGGFLTGGGISFFSPEHGWSCDQITGMEVVLAGGLVVYATATSHADLFSALQGGSNNIGIVTRFDLQTFPLREMLGGIIVYPISTLTEQLNAFATFLKPINFDKKATVIQAYVWRASFGQLVTNDIEYSIPVEDPISIQPFTKILPQFQNTERIGKLFDFVTEQASFQPSGDRGLYANTAFSPNAKILGDIYNLYNQTIATLQGVDGIVYSLIFQRMPTTVPGNKNLLGLSPEAGFLALCQVSVSWSKSSDDQVVNSTVQELIGKIEKSTKAAGLFDKFKYLNYAASFQDPLVGYGSANLEKLKASSRKYDPLGVFQRGVPGGFKLH